MLWHWFNHFIFSRIGRHARKVLQKIIGQKANLRRVITLSLFWNSRQMPLSLDYIWFQCCLLPYICCPWTKGKKRKKDSPSCIWNSMIQKFNIYHHGFKEVWGRISSSSPSFLCSFFPILPLPLPNSPPSSSKSSREEYFQSNQNWGSLTVKLVPNMFHFLRLVKS